MSLTVTCPGCGSPVPAGDRFCGTCGSPVTGSALLSGDGARFDPWTDLLQKLRQATLGEYEIKGELGRGGMAAVFLAHDLHLNRKVAIKVMHPGLVYGERMWDRFLAEARTAAKLDHPNIVYIHSVKEKDRFLYFVMKYIDGRSLDDLLSHNPPLPVPVAQTILIDVARAFDYAHHEGVVHRDIKPANIMIDQKGAAIVMDFGIARVADSQHFTQTGATIGTPAYMSPEQCHGSETTAASDQYSLGILAYEILSGVTPFVGSPIELQVAHLQDIPRPLRDLRPDIPPNLADAVMRMLEKDPAHRWPSLASVIPKFAEGLNPHDDSPRNYLISLIKSGRPRRMSYPATPVSPTPTGGRTPVAPFVARPSAPAVEGGDTAAARQKVETPRSAKTVQHMPVSASGETLRESKAIGQPAVAVAALPEEAAAPALSAPPSQAATPPARAGRPPRRGLVIGGALLAIAALVIYVRVDLNKPKPVAPPPTADAPAPAPTATSALEAALGDSVAVGPGSDAALPRGGKRAKAVSADAVALLKLSIAKPRITAGDTVHARLDAFDDGGTRVTSPQIVWTTSNPRVVRFAAPGELVAVKEGNATITVSAGSSSTALVVSVGPKGSAAPAPIKRR
jgi:serine/threonine-protein kinase